MPSPESIARALREGVTLTRLDHLSALRLSGEGAFDLLDAACTSRLFLREGQMAQTLMLDASARILADVCVAQDEDAWFVFAEGLDAGALRAHLEAVRQALAPDAEVVFSDLREDHVLWSLDGPYAWELASGVLGPQLLGAPYLSFLRTREVTCFRLGKTGEYGYLLLVPEALQASLWAELTQAGEAFELVEGDVAALDRAALENWHFSMRALEHVDAFGPVTPLELQLQWRVDSEKAFFGSEAYLAHRSQGAKVRLTCFVADSAVRALDAVTLNGERIGGVLAASWSVARGQHVGWALLDVKVAHPGIRALRVRAGEAEVAIETRSPPLLDNRSLFVDPHRHSFKQRAQHTFPPVVHR